MKERTQNLLLGFGAGVITTAAIPFFLPVLGEIIRPLTKALIKQSILGVDRLRTNTARAAEALEDIMAEVRVEVAEELARGTITQRK
ncbi:MAG: hypothetical protein RL385_2113 [Pseudomonadota bacterium]|jgi:hypothetical protein